MPKQIQPTRPGHSRFWVYWRKVDRAHFFFRLKSVLGAISQTGLITLSGTVKFFDRWAVCGAHPLKLDDRLLEASRPESRWLVVLFALSLATMRLTILGAVLKIALIDIYFIQTLFFFLCIIWHLVELANQAISQIVIETRRNYELAPLIKLLVLIGHSIIILLGGTILLSHFGVDVAPFATIIGFGGLALSLAAKDIISDFIAGLIILVSHPLTHM